jgi:surface antigen
LRYGLIAAQRGVLLALLLAAGGCTYRLDSLLTKDRDDAVETTGSIAPRAPAAHSSSHPSDGDLAIAKSAAAEILSRGGKDTSVPWENPQTGARGTVTPIASAYSQEGLTCRDFLASYVRNGAESWLQGEACRAAHGKWEVRHLKPLRS